MKLLKFFWERYLEVFNRLIRKEIFDQGIAKKWEF